MYNGMTGEQIEMAIYIGPTYYMRLKHMVKDKINYRARGPNTQLTKQPVAGRANDGGLRIGEMERDVLISHGITAFLNESMLHRADDYSMAICNKTGMMAVYNPSKKLFLSPMADGPLRFIDSFDGKSMGVENISRFGRDFSIVRVPYSLKLLIQELMAINVQMRLITEDNIDQLENLSFSNNISLLTHGALKSPSEVIEAMKKNLSSNAAVEKVLRVKSPTSSIVSSSLEEDLIKYDPYKPADIPETPESIEFGGNNKVDINNEDIFAKPEYSIGDKVYYRSDTIPMRKWNVKHGDNNSEFITIETDDLRDIDDISDTIKVVSNGDIYHASGVINNEGFIPLIPQESEGNYNMIPNNIINHNGLIPGNVLSNGLIPGSINVNPIIKIVNGPDNSIDTIPSESINNSEPINNKLNIPNTEFVNTSDLLKIDGNIGINRIDNNKIENSNNDNKAEDITKIDFSKLMIKKV